jgi:hypothetical protein
MVATVRIVVLALALLGLRADAAWAQGIAPGELSRDHASLEGVDQCTRCHSSGEAIGQDKCLACHRALGQRIADRAGYHARVRGTCGTCHPDHRGRDVPLVRWPGGAPARLDHAATTGFVLRDAHARATCRDCHTPALLTGPIAAKLTAEERPRTYLGLGDTCVSCHADPHEPSLGTDCKACHDEADWAHAGRPDAKFDHGKTRFPLRRSHAKVACEGCHGGVPGKHERKKPPFATCTACHPDPHAARMGAATSCTRCHDEGTWTAIQLAAGTHAPRTFPLTFGHARPPCRDCHGARLDRPVAPTCVGCHADVHRPSLGQACAGCHTPRGWTTGRPAAGFHDRTAFPLIGRHAQVACDRCHDPAKPARVRFRPLPHERCLDCHADPHRGEVSLTCEGCHDVGGFRPARFETADHTRTDFALEGAHRAVACERCHPRPPESPGFARGAPACEACHRDPHGGQFGSRGCAGCHAVAAWAPSRFGKAEHARTGFALAGAHDVGCSRCHAAVGGAPARFVDTPADCGVCHEDGHRGQFPGRPCADCHAGDHFAPAPHFAHARTGFPLRGKHAAAACAACHPSLPVAGAATVVYRLGAAARDCVGCHAAQHGDAGSPRAAPRALAASTRACADCHGETAWSAVGAAARFDHATTGSPLVGGHARAACHGCHRPQVSPVAAMADCAGCHPDRHGGRLGDRCEGCHSPASWKPDAILVDHQRTRLPLLGAHAVQGCPRCHTTAAAGDFRGLDPRCGACHAHTVVERQPHPAHTGAAFRACEDCHSSMAWRPAHIDHDRYWPLTGAHRRTSCAACHPGNQLGGVPRACAGCHQREAAGAALDHADLGTDCAACHTTSAWAPAEFPDHDRAFPLSGPHDRACATCHTTPGMYQAYRCVDCHEHAQARSDRQHDEVAGYTWVSTECYRCHPRGRED